MWATQFQMLELVMWQKAVVANFELLSQHLARGSKKNHEMVVRVTKSTGQDPNPGPPEYELGSVSYSTVMSGPTSKKFI
jgi:hypothetical protein